MKNNYGLSEINPIKLSDSESVIEMLNSIITLRGFRILFHLIDYIVKEKLIIEQYEIFTGDEKSFYLYFNVSWNVNVWIPPDGFIFFNEWVICNDSLVYHGQDYYLTDNCNFEKPITIFDSMEKSFYGLFLFENMGVNYNCKDFPYSMYQMYLDKYTYERDK